MRATGLLLLGVVSSGCSFDSEAVPGPTGDALAGADTTTTTSVPDPPPTPGTSTQTATTGPGSSTTDTTTTTAGASTQDGSTGAQDGSGEETASQPTYSPSCAAILTDDPVAVSGVYELMPPESTAPGLVRVYCDMHTDGGGWMLVGRSVEGEFGGGLFGWGAARGDVDDLSAPYALDAITAGLQFTHILMGNRNEGMQWGNHVYRLRVPADFLDAVDAAVPTEQVDVVVGDCEPIGGPTMLHFGGYTGTPEFFFFRDLDAHAQHGLLHDGFDMFWDDVFGCINGGGLHGDQGMIFVR